MKTRAMKQWATRLGLLMVASSLSSGCIMYRLEELRQTTPTGTAFQVELSRMYMEYATQEEKVYDWQDSWYFADKGLRLAYGNEAGPEELESWNLPPDALDELTKARIRVMDALTPQLQSSDPVRAAQAQFYFDCWVENAEEMADEDQIAECRDGLNRVLDGKRVASRMGSIKAEPIKTEAEKSEPVKLATKKPEPAKELYKDPMDGQESKEAVKEAPKAAKEPVKLAPEPEKPAEKAPEKAAEKSVEKVAEKTEKPARVPFGGPTPPPKDEAKADKAEKAEKPKAEPKTPSVETSSYAVFFEQKKPEISGPGKNVLAEVMQSVKDKKDYAVVLHVASTGAADKELTQKRLQVVRKALSEGGVNESAVYDDVLPKDAKPVARRIELFLNE